MNLNKLLRFVPVLILFSAFTGICTYLVSKYTGPKFPVSIKGILTITLFFCLATLIVYGLVLASVKKSPGKMVNYFMGATTLKFLMCFFLIGAYSLTHAGSAKSFIVYFFINYIVYAVFEVAILFKLLKNKGIQSI